jgi:hypothetical protein
MTVDVYTGMTKIKRRAMVLNVGQNSVIFTSID